MPDDIERRVENTLILLKVQYIAEGMDQVKETVGKIEEYQRVQNGRTTKLEISNDGRDVRIANLCKHVDNLEEKSDKRDWLVALMSLIAATIASVFGGTR